MTPKNFVFLTLYRVIRGRIIGHKSVLEKNHIDIDEAKYMQ